MARPSRQLLIVASLVLAGGSSYCVMAERSRGRPIDAGVWFEHVTYDLGPLGGPVTPQEMTRIESVARSEIRGAFERLPIAISGQRDATYRIAVVQKLRDLRFRRDVWIAGESRGISGLGGQGAVSFSFLASGAVACAPKDADRAAIIDAIGRGVGRTAVHELTHQLLPTAPIHSSTDVASYEYAFAGRCEHYFGEMHWDLAEPLLQTRVGRLHRTAALVR